MERHVEPSRELPPQRRLPASARAREDDDAAHSHARFERLLAVDADAVAARALSLADDFAQLGALEVECGIVVGGVPGCEDAVADEPGVRRTPLRLGVEVGAEAPGEEAEPAAELAQPRAVGVGDGVLEPAVRAGAPAAEDGAALPRLSQGDVDAVHAPDRERVRRVPAAHVDDVLRGDPRRRLLRHPEELEMAGLAIAAGEGVVEPLDALGTLAARRRQKADPRPRFPAQLEQVVLQQ